MPGDDKASTQALFRYLDPGLVPEKLTVQTLRWGGEADKPAPRVEVLALEPQAKADVGARLAIVPPSS
ncbi:hypothetical protein [Arthrobacter cavernae]|uniref:Uncharacterized protein n=1 Tax=Arthrobacter cavernae TaxID=2817681 RepID=A0A939HCU0_9MICC|nr:hypothetical protein [Arthrobacter cavernae]MBO1266809.1 hypothetical protein [Arthrobacter cavernae]